MRRLMRLIARLFLGLFFASVLILAILVVRTNPSPWSLNEIKGLVSGLNEAAAIGVPHFFLMDEADRSSNMELLLKVEQGEELNENESTQYRILYQTVLQKSQRFLARFDRELTVLDGFGTGIGNNCMGTGIEGRHDHHDVSARLNFDELLDSLALLDSAGTFFSRVRYANLAYKDLVDLISHLGVAPHTLSVPYSAAEAGSQDLQLGFAFENMLKNYKRAQFEPVNSSSYWEAISDAETAYVNLILAVQEHVVSKTSDFERRFAGRFLSPQTLAPPVDLRRPLRPHKY